ncbi:Stk1 family PASTA domain-containing Ser/Thr kinase [Geomicrobium sp. JCM 19039]|uniref:Stk1 family PASTA domain-containing Ser/Thr kinase n=1 Tax=Geomicrobium sp. JCM 19039 TaxID=1460636 RepID=UPI00045F1B26|nr:Stk1 family PASTA domain-containing Ser/Thr kinase [Geomicrobium sp. JCM 19039]GAK10869.1 serine/threonine protein kinase PrkC, regulator of stationary phase [Geomicrobium sp. JCM 19039]
MIGSRIDGRYELLDMIGGGGMANVYRAQDVILEREVAVKVLQPQYIHDEEFIRRFRREAQAATSLIHPNVVDIYDVGEEDQTFYIVMNYIGGSTLKDKIIGEGSLPFTEVLEIFDQLTAAISYAHEQGIVHRDLKPQNILIDHDGTVKVTDFGIARAVSAATITHTNSVLGSVHYLSPEQARGGHVTAQADVYALGIILYEMITGVLPFDADSAVSIALKHLQETIPNSKDFRPDVPESINNIIRKATAKDPLKRYASVQEMRADAETALLPERLNEEPLVIEDVDDDQTRVLPALSDLQSEEDTIVASGADEEQAESPAPKKKKKKKKWLIPLIIIFILFPAALVLALVVIPSWLAVDEVQVPDVLGMDVSEAEALLEENNLLITIEREFHDEYEEDIVYYQTPSSGRNVKVDSSVMLRVSDGPEQVEMADVTDMSLEEAEDVLDGFELDVSFEQSSDVDPNMVMSQTPNPGEEVVVDETVVQLVVSETPEFTISDLTGSSEQAASNYIESHNLSGNFTREHSDSVPAGNIISHDPGPFVTVSEGSEITFVVSEGPPPVEEEPTETRYAEIPVNVTNPDAGDVFTIRIEYEDLSTDGETDVFVEEEITESEVYLVPLEVSPSVSGSYTLYVNDEERQSNTLEYEGD